MPDTALSPAEKGIVCAAPDYQRFRRWGGILARFLSVQVAVQAMGFAAGLLLVRSLSKQEYAFYTIANSMQGTFGVLADIGIGSALSAIGGRVWQDRVRFGELIVTGLKARRQLATVAGLVIAPLAFFTLRANGASVFYSAVFCCLLLMGQHFQLLSGILVMVPRLQGRIDVLQRQDLFVTFARLVAIALVALLFAKAGAAVFAATLGFMSSAYLLRRCAAEGANLSCSSRADDAKEIWRVVRQQAPDTVYYCFQSQVTVLLLSWFGNAGLVAEVGALGRISILFSLIGSVMSNIVLPRFARSQDKQRVRQIFLSTLGGYALIGISLLLLVYLVPGPFLWLLGPKYAGLYDSLFYITFSAVVSMLVGALYGLNSSRAWTESAWLSVPGTIVSQIILLPFIDIGTISGVVLLGTVGAVPQAVVFIFCSYRGLRSIGNAT